MTRPDLGIASDDPEEAFLKSTAPLPKSLYGRLNQVSALPGFPASPPLGQTSRLHDQPMSWEREFEHASVRVSCITGEGRIAMK